MSPVVIDISRVVRHLHHVIIYPQARRQENLLHEIFYVAKHAMSGWNLEVFFSTLHVNYFVLTLSAADLPLGLTLVSASSCQSTWYEPNKTILR